MIRRRAFGVTIGLFACFVIGFADSTVDEILRAEGYIRPSSSIESAVLAPWHKNISGGSLNSTKTHLLITESDGMPLLSMVGAEFYNLGGNQIDSKAERDRAITMRSMAGISVFELVTGTVSSIQIPEGVRIYGPRWSPDGTKIAFIGLTDRETSLYVADRNSRRSRKVAENLRLTEVTSFEWLSDSNRIVVPVKPQNLQKPPAKGLASGPRVRLSDTKVDDFPTFPDLLNDPEEITLLKYLMTSQIGIIDVSKGTTKTVGEPRLISSIDAGPYAKGFLVREYQGEFSYIRPAGSGAQRQILLDESGKEVAVISYSGTRAVEIKKEDQPPTRQGLAWRPDGAGLSFVRDEELPKDSKEKPKKQIVLWKAPFGVADIEVVYENKDPFSLVGWGSDDQTIVLSKVNGKKTEYSMVKMGSSEEPKKFWETSSDTDFYSNPGSLVFEQKPGFGRVLLLSKDGQSVFLSGTQYFKNPEAEAPRPFYDRLKLNGEMKPERIWQSSPDMYETADMLDEGTTWLINRQSPTSVNQLIYRANGSEKQITQNQNYVPDVTLAERKRIRVKRDDGVEFWLEATLPKYTTSLSKLPGFIWFYPTEFTNQKVYDDGLRTYNKNLFKRTATATVQLMALEGYVVVDADFPIIGEVNEANNTFVHQLRMNFTAIVDALTEHCSVDRNRMAIGGHSYGAFGTANALAHTSFFKAGIAGDGNYNRTLTPFGFQREPRDIWAAREVYSSVSALLWANQINGALLMYHGLEDQNVGTFPIHSERMFSALEALGKPSAMYMYPYEDHGQIARETRLDMWARWMAWLEKYVKNPEVAKKPEEKKEEATPPPVLN